MPALATLTLAALTGRAVSQEKPPVVGIAFDVSAQVFLNNLVVGADSTRLKQVQRETETCLADSARKFLPYMRWVPLDSASPLPTLAELRLEMKEATNPTGFSRIFVEFSASVEGERIELIEESFKPDLYAPSAVKPTQKPTVLLADLCALIGDRLSNDTFRPKLHDRFLAKVPLARSVNVGNERLFVPVLYDSLRAAPKSELNVSFASQEGDVGNIKLRVVGRTPQSQWKGQGVSCRVIDRSFPGMDGEGWDRKIPEVLRSEIRDLTVSLLTYVHEGKTGKARDAR
jgi:hypothetical protein